MKRFWDWASAEQDVPARLILSGAIDSGESWYEDTVTPAAFEEELAEHEGEPILVEINSPGGDVFAGWEIYNKLVGRKGATGVLITGIAASAASMVAMAADKGMLTICEVGMMMVHNPWTCAAGNAEQLREQADVLDTIREVMLSCYMHRFAGTQEELGALLDAESYLTPARALELGLADSIRYPQEQETASEAAATMAGRYAAMDMGALRERLGLPRTRAVKSTAQEGKKPARAQPRDYLAEADAIIERYGIRL